MRIFCAQNDKKLTLIRISLAKIDKEKIVDTMGASLSCQIKY